jgi:hypothetical protein
MSWKKARPLCAGVSVGGTVRLYRHEVDARGAIGTGQLPHGGGRTVARLGGFIEDKSAIPDG